MGAAGTVLGAAGFGGLAALAGGAAGTFNGTVTGLATQWVALPVVGGVSMATVSTAVGAAVLGVPAAAAGAVLGGAVGVVAGTGIGAGDLGEPIDIDVPDVDKPAIQDWTEQTLTQWESAPGGGAVASAVRDTVAAAPGIDRQVRDFVASQPGGDQVLEQVDTRLAGFYKDSSLGVASNMISDAVGTGIQA
ncbi:MAG: insoluble domain protein, partial [Nocardiaceae bacterium]|nr:insoluble domain protein [Nocardiaceae bacterium]